MQKLQSTDHLQANLLDPYNSEDRQRRERLMQTIDKLNEHYGNGTMSWAAGTLKQGRKMRHERMSSAMTTQATRLPIVRS